MIYFHTTLAADFDLAHTSDICLTDDRDASETYVAAGGRILSVSVPSLTIADQDDLRAAGAALGMDGCYAFELADSDDVRARLAADGFDAVEYDDMTPDNAIEHTTLRVFGSACQLLAIDD